MQNNMKKIALITGSSRPIPETRGGAIQTMMTHLLDVNEKQQKTSFVIYSYYESEALQKSRYYQYSEFRYYRANYCFDWLCSLPSRFLRKITGGRTYIKSNFVRWCVKQIKRDKPDVVVIEGNYFQTLQLASAINYPLILHMHIDGLHIGTDNAANIFSSCKAIFAISDYCRNRISQIDPLNSNKVITVRNTIDTEHFNVAGRAEFRETIRRKYAISDSDKVFIYCGRLDEVKGVKEAIQAFIALNKENTVFLIVGSSVYKDGRKTNYVRTLEKLAKQSEKKIIFTGYIPQDELPNYYAAADIALVPSQWQEAAGNVIIEALSCGVPVIATTQGGIPEYADTQACSLIKVDGNFIQSLTKAMADMLDNEEEFKQKKACARAIALKYDKQHYYHNFCTAVNDALRR